MGRGEGRVAGVTGWVPHPYVHPPNGSHPADMPIEEFEEWWSDQQGNDQCDAIAAWCVEARRAMHDRICELERLAGIRRTVSGSRVLPMVARTVVVKPESLDTPWGKK